MRRIVPVLLAVILLSACSSIDCPLNNQAYVKYVLKGDVDAIPGILSVSIERADGTDTLVLNQLSYAPDFILPVSYNRPTDVLLFQLTGPDDIVYTDTVTLNKTDYPHFESVDCPPSYFHELKGVTWTQEAIDSIIITNPTVTNDTTGGHVQIYFKSDL